MAIIVNDKDKILQASSPRLLYSPNNYIYFSEAAPVFNATTAGVPSPASYAITALLAGQLTGTVTWSVVSGSVDITGISGNTLTIDYADLTSDSAVIRASLVFLGLTYTANLTINKVKSGADAVSVILSNEAHVFPAATDGTVTVFTNSGTDIRVYEGAAELAYDGVGTTNGTWTVVAAATNITTGAITDEGQFARVAQHSGLLAANDTAKITYTITGKTSTGATFTATKTQTFSKAKSGTSPLIYAISTTTPVITKDAPDATTAGTYSTVSIQGTRYDGSTTTNFGWVTVTANGATQATTATNTALTPFVLSPLSTAGTTSYTIRLYNQATVSTATLLDTQVLNVVFKGQTGVSAVSVILSNEAHTFTTANDGTVSSYTNSGTEIRVYEGATELIYDGVGNNAGTWKFTTNPLNITVGTITDSGNYATVGAHGNFTSTSDTASIAYTITGTISNGTIFSATKTQTFSKSKTGATGSTGATGTRVATGYVYYNSAQSTTPGTPSATSYNYTTGAFTSLSTGWGLTQTISTNTDTANDKWWAARFYVTESSFGGTQTISFSAAFVYTNFDGLVTFTNLATASGTTFIDGGNIETGTLQADRITSGTAPISYAIPNGTMSGSFSLGDPGQTVVNNTFAIGKFDVNTNRGWALSATNSYTGNQAVNNWANGAMFATKANAGVGAAAYNVATQTTSFTAIRALFTGGAHDSAVLGFMQKTSSYPLTGTPLVIGDSGSVVTNNFDAKFRCSAFIGGVRTHSVIASFYGDQPTNLSSGTITNLERSLAYIGTSDYAGLLLYRNDAGQEDSRVTICPVGSPYGIDISGGGNYVGTAVRAPGGFFLFTGAHELESDVDLQLGDIVLDDQVLSKIDISNVVCSASISNTSNQRGVIGVVARTILRQKPGRVPPTPGAPDIDESQTTNSAGVSMRITAQHYSDNDREQEPWRKKYKIMVNALGEGQINVCGENGNIQRGDLIVTSSIPGKGMRQTDDIVRSYTVAKARESVTFSSPTEVKMIACTYHCG